LSENALLPGQVRSCQRYAYLHNGFFGQFGYTILFAYILIIVHFISTLPLEFHSLFQVKNEYNHQDVMQFQSLMATNVTVLPESEAALADQQQQALIDQLQRVGVSRARPQRFAYYNSQLKKVVFININLLCSSICLFHCLVLSLKLFRMKLHLLFFNQLISFHRIVPFYKIHAFLECSRYKYLWCTPCPTRRWN
jgi:hypothetical protein